MKKPKPTPETIGLYVREERDSGIMHGYYHVKVSAVTIGLTCYERRMIDTDETYRPTDIHYDTIRNTRDEMIETSAGRLYLHDLEIYSQGNNEDADRHLYAWRVAYSQIHHVELETAERMAQTLKTIARRMDKETARIGRPLSFGQYCARVAVAIGASEIIIPRGDTRHSSYDQREHTRASVSSGADYIDHMVRKWTRENQPAA